MAELVQLDVAAALVGKSEVTLRRLIKAGKVPVHKEKTLTGFIYLIDPDKLQAYYESRGEITFESMEEAPPEPVDELDGEETVEPVARRKSGRRLAVAGESGGEVTYWQRRAETYEERYHAELQKHATAREELGVWRGRAEHAQAMLMKLLPPVPEVLMNPAADTSTDNQTKPLKRRDDTSPGMMVLLVTTVVISFFLLAGAVVYVVLIRT